MDAGGIIQSASDSVESVFGWTPTELFGKNVKVLIPEPRRSALDRYLDRYRHADQTKTLTRTRRFDAIRKDGTGIQIELSVSRAELPLNTAPHFIGIIRDVTNQIDSGVDTPEQRTRLHRFINEQTCALATAHLRLQLADRLASLGTLAAGLGHDMNNVLLPIRARLNALEHAGITGPALTHLHAVRRSISYLQHLTDGLHFIALDPDGPSMTDKSEGFTPLAKWWSQVGSLLRTAVPKYVTVSVNFAPTLPAVNIGPHWLTQAMLNLIVNAGEAIGSDKRRARRKGVVRITATRTADDRFVRLIVTDNGIGMTAAVQRRAMDLFFTTKSRGLGTGLGLPLARKIAIRAGGDLRITSSPRRGTTVTLVLPALQTKHATGATPAKELAATVSSPVAVVNLNDNRTTSLVSQILVVAGFTIRTPSSLRPGNADLWITTPTPRALAIAPAWLKRGEHRAIVLVGPPSRASRARWLALGAVTIDPPGDFEAMRHTIGLAVASTHPTPAPISTPAPATASRRPRVPAKKVKK